MKATLRKLHWVLVFLFPSILQVQAQTGTIQAFLPPEVGSPGHVNNLIKTADGFLWIATQEGLFRYDGYKLLPHRPAPEGSTSIPNAFIWTLFEDHQEQLWLGTYGSGLARYDRTTGKFFHYPLPAEERETQSVRTITEGPNHQLWIGTEQGIWQFDPTNDQFSPVEQPEDTPLTIINSFHFLDEDHLLVGAQEGALIYQLSEEQWLEVVVADRGVATIDTLQGKLWLGTYNGLLVGEYYTADEYIRISGEIAIDNQAEAGTLNNAVSTLLIDEADKLWIGTLDGLYTYDPQEDLNPQPVITSSNYDLPDSYINALLQIEPGLIGIGTRQGLHSLSNQPSVFHHLNSTDLGEAFCNNVVLGSTEDEAGNWWLGTQGGLVKMSPQYEENVRVPTSFMAECLSPESQAGMPEAYVINTRNFAEEQWVTFWRGGLRKVSTTASGDWQFDSIPGLAALTQNAGIHDIVKSQAGSYWIATPNRGALEWLPNLDSIKVYEPKNGSGLLSPYIFHLLEDQQGQLWVGTANGGLCYRALGQDTFTCFTQVEGDASSLSNNLVLSVYEDQGGQIWASTAGGLNRWLGEGRFERFTTANGLPSDIVYGMLEAPNSNDYWLSTNNGLVRMRRQDKTWDFQVFQAADGLQANEFNQYAFFRTQRGLLCFGGPAGLTYFDPNEVGAYGYTAPVALTDFQLFNQSQLPGGLLERTINETDVLKLKHQQNFLAFEFAALGYTQSAQNTYAYQMVGVDDDWVDAGTRRYASYPQMPPGEYTFRVKAANHDGIWGDDVRTLQIIISPPWWQRWWAYLLYGASFVGLVLFIFQNRLRALRRIDDARQREREAFRKKTARDFHDEAGNKITKMSLLTEVVKRQTQEQGELQPLLGQLEQSIQDLRLGMRDFIWVLDPQHDNLYDTLLRVKVFGQQLFEHSGTQFNFPSIPAAWAQHPLSSPVRRHLLLICKEALHNALKHAHAEHVKIAFQQNGHQVQLRICDDGQGFTSNEQEPSGSGLRNMHERAKKINGALQIHQIETGGTCVELQFKITQMQD